jgi:hypothetical protein
MSDVAPDVGFAVHLAEKFVRRPGEDSGVVPGNGEMDMSAVDSPLMFPFMETPSGTTISGRLNE